MRRACGRVRAQEGGGGGGGGRHSEDREETGTGEAKRCFLGLGEAGRGAGWYTKSTRKRAEKCVDARMVALVLDDGALLHPSQLLAPAHTLTLLKIENRKQDSSAPVNPSRSPVTAAIARWGGEKADM